MPNLAQMTVAEQTRLIEIMERANEAGVKLEIVAGLPIWEAFPVIRHQKAIDRIRPTIRPIRAGRSKRGRGCGCWHYSDIYILFPEGSLKRPDISIFCRQPAEDEEGATRQLPEAVIEVISKGYEAKDLDVGLQFYLAQGVKDVVVFNPQTLLVVHARKAGVDRHISPVTLKLECGCQCTV
jgi:hypothetical protein